MNKTIAFYARSIGILLCLLLPSLAHADDVKPWVELSGTSLLFHYDDDMESCQQYGSTVYELPTEGGVPGWHSDGKYVNVKEVTFSVDFANARPKTCESWFEGMKNLKVIRDFDCLNTSEVTNMKNMFKGVTSKTSLDAATTYLNTEKVTTMEGMFSGCTALESLDLRTFNTEKVTNMDNMFYGCSSLAKIETTNKFSINTSATGSNMFSGCSKLRNYNAQYVGIDKAKDFSLQGYLTNDDVLPTAWARWHDGILTLHYDKYRYLETYAVDLPLDGAQTSWYKQEGGKGVTTIVISNSIKDVHPTSCAYWFRNLESLVRIDSLSNLNTDQVTDMNNLFAGCTSLTGLDLSTFNTENVTNMASMFSGCTQLSTVDLSSFSTAKVANMSSMFYNCHYLRSLDLKNFNTESVIDMSNMFYGCNNLTSLDLSSFSTPKVTTMASMFENCYRLASIDMKNFTTASVTDMSRMFLKCNVLGSLDLSKFSTEKVTDMNNMFTACEKLTSLDLTSFNTANLTNTANMFNGCINLKSISVSKDFVTSKVTADNSKDMFASCGQLPNFEAAYVDINKAKDVTKDGYLLNSGVATKPWVEYKESIKTLIFHYDKLMYGYTAKYDLPTKNEDNSWISNDEDKVKNITKVVFNDEFKDVKPTTLSGLLYGMSALTEIDGIENLNTSEATDMSSMFEGCAALTSVDLSKFSTEKVTDMSSLFKGCSALTALDVSTFSTQKVTSMASMFENCAKVDKLDLRNFNTAALTNTASMFAGCSALEKINVTNNFTVNNVTSSTDMFKGCTKLPSFDSTSANDIAKATDYTNKGYFNNLDGDSAPWAEYVESTKTLTFHYNRGKATSTATGTYDIPSAGQEPGWLKLFDETNVSKMYSPVTKVVFDKDFEDVRPATCAKWFYNMAYLSSIEGLEYLNTSEVTDMSSMFKKCMSLTGTLDLSTFSTAKVTTMHSMFEMMGRVTDINLSSFNTENVTAMNNMFDGCASLTSLDLTNFNTTKVTSNAVMFRDCQSMTNVYVSDAFKFNFTADTETDNMFYNCVKLLNYDSNKIGMAKAKDVRLGGYLNNVDLKAAMWAGYEDGTRTLTLYYDDTMKDSDASKKMPLLADDGAPAWLANYAGSIERVNFDRTFAEARPNSTANWFKGLTKLASINGLGNFNTSDVTDMSYMFSGCSTLTSLDLSTFSTEKVTTMAHMFDKMSNVTSINLSSFGTAAVTNMDNMFDGCSALTSLDLTSFVTEKVDSCMYMFQNCAKLAGISVTDNFAFGEKTVSDKMFAGCTSLLNFDSNSVGKEKVMDVRLGGYLFNGDLKAAMWAAYSESTSTLTFHYDDKMKDEAATKKMIIPAAGITPAWQTYKEQIHQVTFDNSFIDARPESTADWFNGMKNLTTLYQLSKLNTSEVTDMSSMFKDCQALTSLDLSTFSTDKVTDMNNMFNDCNKLTSLTLTSFNTENVVDMESMFNKCSTLPTLELTSFNTAKVKNTKLMFTDCSALKTITVSNAFALDNDTISEGMFQGCSDLINFDSKLDDKTKAKDIRLGGYLCNSDLKAAMWAGYSEGTKTMTLYYDDTMKSNTTATKKFAFPSDCEDPAWTASCASSVVKVDFDNTFANARPESTAKWFKSMSSLTTLYQIENLNTSDVTDMSEMFYDCSKVTTIDMSKFNTEKVLNMNGMFRNCNGMTSIDLSTFNTSHVSDMSNMFYDCSGLKKLDVSSFLTDNVTNMESMFNTCSGVDSLDLTGFNTAKVTNMKSMFSLCSALHGIKVSDLFTVEYVESSDNMFYQCSGLPSFDSNSVDKTKAKDKTEGGYFDNVNKGSAAWVEYNSSTGSLTFHYDKLKADTQATGKYDLPKAGEEPAWKDLITSGVYNQTVKKVIFKEDFKNVRPVTCAKWFNKIIYLESIEGLQYLNTSNVTDMSYMFAECAKLTDLDLSTFNTDNVTTMEGMFYQMQLLKNINLSSFNTANVVSMNKMFQECMSLDTLNLTNFNTAKVTNNALMFKDCQKLKRITVKNSFAFSGTFESDNMFADCLALRNYDSSSIGIAKAKDIRLGGYLCNVDLKAAMWADYDSQKKKLTFHYDDSMKDSEADKTFALPADGEDPAWIASKYASLITSVEFDNTCSEARPTSCAKWFKGMTKLTGFDGMQYFNTSEVTDMSEMFQGCTAVTYLPLTYFNTAKVSNVESMFKNCSALEIINVTKLFAVPSDAKSTDMFDGCVKLPLYNASLVDGSKAKDVTLDGYFYDTDITPMAWVDYDYSAQTLTFRYDKLKYKAGNHGYTLPEAGKAPFWLEYNTAIKKVIINPGFKDVRPETCEKWFNGMTHLTEITGMEYLNTSEVTDMSGMFAGCDSLATVSLSNFNTEKVTSMADMFNGCKLLSTIDLSTFVTQNVTDMSGMFANCEALTTLDVSKLTTTNVTSMADMFSGDSKLTTLELKTFSTTNVKDMSSMLAGCKALTSIDVSSFDTQNVNNMAYMFSDCQGLSEISVTNFNTANVTNIAGMFSGCSKVTTLDLRGMDIGAVTKADKLFNNDTNLNRIYVSKKFSIANVTTHSDVFTGCQSLPNYSTTCTWEVSINDVSKGGYLYNVDVLKPCVEYDETNKALKFHYSTSFDFDSSTNSSTIYQLPTAGKDPDWLSLNANITSVTIDEEFSQVTPINCKKWFQGMSQVTTIEGIRYMNTSEATDMSYMFDGCEGLTSLDLSSFNTKKVTTMESMFSGCKSLTKIAVCWEFTTDKVTTSTDMFKGCEKLTNYKADNATDKSMAKDITEGGYLDSSSEENSAWVQYVEDGETLTFHYDKLKNATTTVADGRYDLPKDGETPAWIDGHQESIKKVVFNSDFAEVHPVTCAKWFYKMKSLNTIEGIENLNTSESTDMSDMFNECGNITSLDLSHFETEKVTTMARMFRYISTPTLDLRSFDTKRVNDVSGMFHDIPMLTNIYVSEKFVLENATGDDNTFRNSKLLPGYDASVTNQTKANYEDGYLTLRRQFTVGDDAYTVDGYGNNAICQSDVTFTDGKAFTSAFDFAFDSDKTASYTRSVSSHWATLCLPFAFSADDNTAVKFYTVNTVGSDKIVVTAITGTVDAGTPVLAYISSGNSLSISATGAKAVAEPVKNENVAGVFTQTDVDGNGYIISKDRFWNVGKLKTDSKAEHVYATPYRAYISNNSSSAKAVFLDITIDEADGIHGIETDNSETQWMDGAEIYDLQGHRLNAPQRGVNIIRKNGVSRKFVVN